MILKFMVSNCNDLSCVFSNDILPPDDTYDWGGSLLVAINARSVGMYYSDKSAVVSGASR